MAYRILIPDLPAPPSLPAGEVVEAAGETMGTTWSVRVAGRGQSRASLTAAVTTALDEVIRQMSQWRANSDLSRFNSAPAGEWTPVLPEFEEVLAVALNVARTSGGAFDPTVGALAELWGFGSSGPRSEPPTTAAIRDARAAAGWRRLDFNQGRIRQPGGLRLDLSGIAKGFAVDHVHRRLTNLGIDSLLVEIGGELRGAGVRPDGNPWWVEIEPPPGSPFSPARLALCGAAIATSGDYRRVLKHGDRRYPHTLDPRTGYPVTHDLASVSVVTTSAMTADAHATAIMVLGPREGYDYAVGAGLAALLIDRNGGDWREAMTPRLIDMLA